MIGAQRMLKAIVNWHNIQAVIFDVDGTLYNQGRLRVLMLRDLLVYYLLRPHQWKDLLILYYFRLLRDEMTDGRENNGNLLGMQYRLTAEKADVSGKRVEECIVKWIMTYPLKYLRALQYPGLLDFYHDLRESSIKVAAFSDYPAAEKLRVLGMAEIMAVCTADPEVSSMKPSATGLLLLVEKLDVPIGRCLFIGDREEKDGECARRINMPYLIKTANTEGSNQFRFYEDLCESFRQFRRHEGVKTRKERCDEVSPD